MVGSSEIGVKTANLLVGNKLSRELINYCSNGDRDEKNLLHEAIDSYFTGRSPDIKEKVKIFPIVALIELARLGFGLNKKTFQDFFQEPYTRRGLVNAIRSIGEYGISLPQKLSSPFLIVWNFTNACNLRCKHCYQKAGKSQSDELGLGECLDLVDQLAANDVAFIAFSGGEPLLREDLPEVARHASEQGIYVSVASNGTLLTKGKVEELVDSGVRHVQISLDGAKAESHDDFRGVPGAWEKAIEGIKNCVESPLATSIATTITRHNYKEFDEIVYLAKRLKVGSLVAYNFIPTGRGSENAHLDIAPDMREKLLTKEYEYLSQDFEVLTTDPQLARVCLMKSECGPISISHFARARASSRLRSIADAIGGCGAGRAYCAIQPDGIVTPCVFIPIKVGSIRQRRFIDIWKNSEVLKSLRERDDLRGYCNECKFKFVCGGCRARAYGYFGDLKAPDIGCIYNKGWAKVLEPSIDIKGNTDEKYLKVTKRRR